jgi:hypothetical protein
VDWYEHASRDDPISQGEIVRELVTVTYEALPVPPETIDGVLGLPVEVEYFNCIVLSQSCDLENEKVDNVLLCPVFDILVDDIGNMAHKGKIKEVMLGRRPTFHLLDRCDFPGIESGPLLVHFGQVLTVPFGHLKSHIGQTSARVRLASPYREDLSQAFARFVMRVGLPKRIDIEGIF